ncbi:MAG: 3-hydroxyisobutyrate dehydrogenase [Pseudomonadales bacterium]
MTKVGFIGLGNMGDPMARNLIQSGFELRVFDLVRERMKAVVEAGGYEAQSAKAAIADAEFVISMLPASEHVESLYLEPGRLLEAVPDDAVVVDCSTIAAGVARRVAHAAGERGIAMLDAPVSGGTAGAENASLTFIVGGDGEALERARPLLAAMGANIFHAGAHGAGQVAKICNNLLLAVQMTGTAEALALGAANGLDPKVLSEIMRESSGGNWALNVYNPYPGVMDSAPAARGYQGGFLVDLMIKDLGLAMEAADEVRASTPMGSLARSLYLLLRRQHDAGALDFSSIQRLYLDREQS